MATTLLAFICCMVPARTSDAESFSANPRRSLLVNVSLGAGFDLDKEVRSPPNYFGEHVEAYSLGSFVIGIDAAFRFNEIIALETGWNEAQHRAPDMWGGTARYTLGHLALRLAWPLKTRQTPLIKIGPAIGRFTYGSATYAGYEDNDTLAVGGMISMAIEHEFALGIVGTLGVSYLPLYRLGMDGVLVLEEVRYTEDGSEVSTLGSKDFTKDEMIHLVFITAGIQFEWVFR